MPFQLNSDRPKLATEGMPTTSRLMVKAGRMNHHPERRPGARPRRRGPRRRRPRARKARDLSVVRGPPAHGDASH